MPDNQQPALRWMHRQFSIAERRLRATFGVLTLGLFVVTAGSLTFHGVVEAQSDGDLLPLLSRLDAPTRAERDAAEAALREYGPGLLPQLDRLRNRPLSPAATAALARVRTDLERQRAEQALRPSQVTLAVEQTPLAEVLAAVTQQTGNVFLLSPEQAVRPVRLSLDHVPFWQAVEAITAPLSLTVAAPQQADGTLTLRAQTAGDTAVHVSSVGPVRLAIRPAIRRPIAGDATATLLRVPLSVMVEPRLRPLFLKYEMSDFQVVGSRASTVPAVYPPFSPDAKYELPLGARGQQVELPLDFLVSAATAVPDSPGVPHAGQPAMLRLRGRVLLTIAAGVEQFTFPASAATAEDSQGGVSVRFQGVTRTAQATQVDMSVIYDAGGPAFESHRGWVLQNAAGFRRPDGTAVAPAPQFTTLRQTADGAALRFRFENLPADLAGWQFTYEAPTQLIPLTLTVDTPV